MVNSFIKILGVNISRVNSYHEVYERIKKNFNNTPFYITVNNVHTVIAAVLDKEYKNIINNSFMALPDGKPLSMIALLKGEKDISRIFGPTFFEKVIEWGEAEGRKHYFFGSSEETLERMIDYITRKFPSAVISGSFSPPFRKFTSEENVMFLNQMNESEADIFWIGLGAPKQEVWMYENYQKLNHGLMIGIGAGFDYLAGNLQHAPLWMKDSSLEWVYRLIQEPKRLWKRYLVSNFLFVIFILLDLFKLKKFE